VELENALLERRELKGRLKDSLKKRRLKDALKKRKA
jgi:hypothetical protein